MGKKYLYEVDFMRNFFIAGVLLNHIVGIAKGEFATDSTMYLILACLHASLHFTRMGFMFMTGLVLFLAYRSKPVKVWSFWKKRYVAVGIPYLFWNALYCLLLAPTTWLQTFWQAVIHGDQAYLYYVLVTMQLYLLFPVLLWVVRKQQHHAKEILLLSFSIQVALTVAIKYWLPGVDTSGWPYLFSHYGNFVLTYQFYFLLGGFTAFHYEKVVSWLEARRLFFKSMVLGFVPFIWCYYLWDRLALGLSDERAKSVHQPLFILYALGMIGFVFLLGRSWARFRAAQPEHWFSRWIVLGAQCSFGIYLTQTLGISLVRAFWLPLFHHQTIGIWFGILSAFAFVYSLSFGLTVWLYRIPGFARLIGRQAPQKIKGGQQG